MVLPADAVGRLVRAAGIGEVHVALAATAEWLPADEEAAADERAWSAIAGAGGLDPRGRIDRDVEATLGLLCRPAVEYYGWLFRGDRTIGVLAAATGRDAVLAVRAGDDITLAQADADGLAAALVAQVPPWQAGKGQPLQFDPAELGGRPVGPRRPAVELRQIRHLTSLPTTGGGQLFAAVRDSAGRRRATPSPPALRRHHRGPLAEPDDRRTHSPGAPRTGITPGPGHPPAHHAKHPHLIMDLRRRGRQASTQEQISRVSTVESIGAGRKGCSSPIRGPARSAPASPPAAPQGPAAPAPS